MSDLYVSKANASIVWQGRRLRLQRGRTVARAGHPILEAYGSMFAPLVVDYDVERPVEQATAAPGEKRPTRARKPADE